MVFFTLYSVLVLSNVLDGETSICLDDPRNRTYTFELPVGYGFAMIEWPDAILKFNISYKKFSYRNTYSIFKFGSPIECTIQYHKRVLFNVFKIPQYGKSLFYFSDEISHIYEGINEPINYDIYVSAYGPYNARSYIQTNNTVSFKYYDGETNTNHEFYADGYFKNSNPIHNSLRITSENQYIFHGINVSCQTQYESTLNNTVQIDFSQEKSGDFAYRDFLRYPNNSKISFSEIEIEEYYKLRFFFEDLAEKGYTFQYRFNNDKNYIDVVHYNFIESAENYSLSLYVSSEEYPNCDKIKLEKEYYFGDNNWGLLYTIRENELPDICVPPRAKLIITNNISYPSEVLYNESRLSTFLSNGKTGKIFSYNDFSSNIRLTVDGKCKDYKWKTIEVKVGDSIEIIVNDIDLPPICRATNTTTYCFCRENCEDCSEGIEDRVVEINDISKLYKGEESNMNIRICENVSMNAGIFEYKHIFTICPNTAVLLSNVTRIIETDNNEVSFDNLNMDPKYIKQITINQRETSAYLNLNQSIFYYNRLIIKVPEENLINAKFSQFVISGDGIVSLYNFPADKLINNDEKHINVVPGIYIICNSSTENSNCPEKEYDIFKVNNLSSTITSDIPQNAYVYVFLDTYSDTLDVEVKNLHHPKLTFIESKDLKVLDENENKKLRILSTEQLYINTSNLEIGDAEFRLSSRYLDYDRFIFSFNNLLTLKQSNNPLFSPYDIVLEPTKKNSFIYFDESFNNENQIFLIKSRNDQKINFYVGEKDFTLRSIRNFMKCENECNINNFAVYKGEPPESFEDIDNEPKDPGNKGGLGPGPIAGIVIGIIVVIAAAIIGVIFFLKKKKKNEASSNEAAEI
ncbi:hypothetical protein M9Y10_032272 [Tritrichomonas musculus]|uniref:Uncharacterized protein n=1 Tax=Tritrichomonas musculus TaxID=1915356 RepID=A0ABR2H0J2_9EUKA